MGACAPFPTAGHRQLVAVHGPPGLTHKVRSLGMWLKLDTGMVVMLLLFRVLGGNQSPLASVQQERMWEGEQNFPLTNRQALTCSRSTPSWPALGWIWVGGLYQRA